MDENIYIFEYKNVSCGVYARRPHPIGLSMTYDPDITAPYDVSDVSYII
jgi:hypothetical protein